MRSAFDTRVVSDEIVGHASGKTADAPSAS